MVGLWCWFKTCWCSLSVNYNKLHVNHTHLLLWLTQGSAGVNWSKEGLQLVNLQGLIMCQTSKIGKQIRGSCSQAKLILSTQRTWLLGKRGFPSHVHRNMSPKPGKFYSENFPSVLEENNCFTLLFCFRWNN